MYHPMCKRHLADAYLAQKWRFHPFWQRRPAIRYKDIFESPYCIRSGYCGEKQTFLSAKCLTLALRNYIPAGFSTMQLLCADTSFEGVSYCLRFLLRPISRMEGSKGFASSTGAVSFSCFSLFLVILKEIQVEHSKKFDIFMLHQARIQLRISHISGIPQIKKPSWYGEKHASFIVCWGHYFLTVIILGMLEC